MRSAVPWALPRIVLMSYPRAGVPENAASPEPSDQTPSTRRLSEYP
jgi:hypothetical protein